MVTRQTHFSTKTGFNIIIYFMIFIYPLAFIMQLINFKPTSTPMQLIAIITIIVGIWHMITDKPFRIEKKYTFLILIYFFLMLLNDYFRNEESTFGIIDSVKTHLPLLALFFFINLLDNAFIQVKTIRMAYRVFFLIVLIAPIVSIYQYFVPSFVLAYQEMDVSALGYQDIYNIRRNSIFLLESNVALGVSFLPIALLLSFKYFKERRNGSFLFVLLSMGIVVFLTNTRLIMMGYAIIVLSYILFTRAVISRRIMFFLTVLFAAFAAFYTLSYLGYSFNDFYEYRLSEGSQRTSDRWDSFFTFLKMFPEYYMWGTGSHQSMEVTRFSFLGRTFIHIGWLSAIIAFGVVICFFLFGFYYKLIRNLFRDFRKTGDFTTFISFILFVAYNFTYVNLDSFSSGLMLALVFNQYNLQKIQFSNNLSINPTKVNAPF